MSKFRPGRHLRVLDVMTSEVITADPLDGFKEVAERLYASGVSALPVLDGDRRVIGVISEGDLLVKEGGEPKRSRLHPHKSRQMKAKAEATSTAQAMTAPALTITPDATVAEAARLMYHKGVKQLPVVDADGRLMGVVSRHDVIKVFVRSDASIRDEVIDGVIGGDLMIEAYGVVVGVEGGIVDISGKIERRTDIGIIAFLVGAVDGVVAVNNSLTSRWDDTHVDAGPMGRWGSANPL